MNILMKQCLKYQVFPVKYFCKKNTSQSFHTLLNTTLNFCNNATGNYLLKSTIKTLEEDVKYATNGVVLVYL